MYQRNNGTAGHYLQVDMTPPPLTGYAGDTYYPRVGDTTMTSPDEMLVEAVRARMLNGTPICPPVVNSTTAGAVGTSGIIELQLDTSSSAVDPLVMRIEDLAMQVKQLVAFNTYLLELPMVREHMRAQVEENVSHTIDLARMELESETEQRKIELEDSRQSRIANMLAWVGLGDSDNTTIVVPEPDVEKGPSSDENDTMSNWDILPMDKIDANKDKDC